MAETAFQPNAFQNDAFQVNRPSGVQRGASKRRKRDEDKEPLLIPVFAARPQPAPPMPLELPMAVPDISHIEREIENAMLARDIEALLEVI
jgi:hypothetical protein